jgi:hypothetical protein
MSIKENKPHQSTENFTINNVVQDYISKIEKRKLMKKSLTQINKDIRNIRKNVVHLHNLIHKEQIIVIDNCIHLELNKKNCWKDKFLVFLFNAGVPNCWILDLQYKLENFFSANEPNTDSFPNFVNTVYIKTINYVTSEKIKKIIKTALEKKSH